VCRDGELGGRRTGRDGGHGAAAGQEDAEALAEVTAEGRRRRGGEGLGFRGTRRVSGTRGFRGRGSNSTRMGFRVRGGFTVRVSGAGPRTLHPTPTRPVAIRNSTSLFISPPFTYLNALW
jgi:hypothetical protein